MDVADVDPTRNCDLQDENEEMGRDLSEGHVHALERQLALAKAALEDMRRAYLQLEDVTQQLDNEAEDLQAQVTWLPYLLLRTHHLTSSNLPACERAFTYRQRAHLPSYMLQKGKDLLSLLAASQFWRLAAAMLQAGVSILRTLTSEVSSDIRAQKTQADRK